MARTKVLQEVRLMKCNDIYSRRTAGMLTQEQAADILSVSIRTVRRWEERFDKLAAAGVRSPSSNPSTCSAGIKHSPRPIDGR